MKLKGSAALLILVCASAASLHAQSAASGSAPATKAASPAAQSELIAQLDRETRLLEGSQPTSTADVSRMEALLREIRATGDAALVSRAELVLVLFQEREASVAKTQALNASLKADSEMLHAASWHERKKRLAATSFGVGVASLAVLGLSFGVTSWAYNAYVNAGSASEAAPYYTVGKVGQIASIVGPIGAIGGFGFSWLLEVNPFDDLGVSPSYPRITYPRPDMTNGEKIAYLTETRSRDESQLAKAAKARFDAGQFFKMGIAATVMTAAFGYIESTAYRNYSSASTPQDASGWRTTLDTFGFAAATSAVLAGIGLSGAAIHYLSSPSPEKLNASIHMLDAEIASLRASQ